jgi:2-oxoglutarate ferredoxin oxidoreductase subunit alpha
VDGDGIPYRTLPGVHPKGVYFTRGSGHTKYGRYTEDPDEYTEVLDRIARKIAGAATAVPAPEIQTRPDTSRALVTVGACGGAVREALEVLEAEDQHFDYMRIRGFPFSSEVAEFLAAHDVNFVIEQNRDAQLKSLLLNETPIGKDCLASIRYYGGYPMSAHHVLDGIRAHRESEPELVAP